MKVAYAMMAIFVMSAAAKGRHLMFEQPSSTLAKHMAALARDNAVVLTSASCGYLEFADNWIAHVEALGISNWLTVAQDAATLQYLSERQGPPMLRISIPCQGNADTWKVLAQRLYDQRYQQSAD